jgi:type I restriction enzyme S subunit
VREKGVILRDLSGSDDNRNFIPDDLSNYKRVRPGQFAMNKMKAWQGSYGVSEHEGIVSPAYFVFDLRGVEGRFFHTAIRSRAYVPFFTQASDGVRIGQWDLSDARMREIPFFVPPPSEQTAIVRFIDHADRRIRRYVHAKQKLIALLEEQRQVVIQRAVNRGLDQSARIKVSGIEWLGDVPEHWTRWRLKALLRVVDVRSTTGDETLLSIRREHGIVPYAEHFFRPFQAKTLVGFKIVERDQLVVNRLQANNGLIFRSPLRGLVSPDYSVFAPVRDVELTYLQEVLRSQVYRAHFRRESTGLGTGTAGFLRLYDDRFLETPVFLPPLSEQKSILDWIAQQLRTTNSRIDNEAQALALTREYRTRLIADVVTGKLDVRDAAARLQEDVDERDESDEPETEDEVKESSDELDAVASEAEA